MTPQRVYGDTFWRLLAPIRPLLEDPDVTEVLINGPERIFVERNGQLEPSGRRLGGSAELLAVLRSAAQYAGEELDESERLIGLTLPDGVRLWAALPPLARDGPVVRMRRPHAACSSLAELGRCGALPTEVAELLSSRVEAGSNMVIVGRSRSGKTAVLAALAAAIPARDRVLVLSHGRELRLEREHVVCLDQAMAVCGTEPQVDPHHPFRAALSLRPDWVVLSELRGGEALALIRIMALRDVRWLTTVEATTAQHALRRIEALARSSDARVSLESVRSEIAAGLDVVIHVEPDSAGHFRVAHVVEVGPLRHGRAGLEVRDLFVSPAAHASSGDGPLRLQ